MLESIKETDRYTNDDRLQLAVGGAALTVVAVGFNYALYVSGYYSIYLIVLLLMGPVLIGKSVVAEYKGNIQMVHCPRQVQRVCPSCQEQGNLEWYNEKLGQDTERQYRVVYTRVKTTVYWRRMIHCRGCGFKAVRGEGGEMDLQQLASDDPVAKARAILEASKAKGGKTTTYEKVDTEDDHVGMAGSEMELTENQLPSSPTPMVIV